MNGICGGGCPLFGWIAPGARLCNVHKFTNETSDKKMNNIKPYLRKIIYTVPGAKALWIGLNKFLGRGTQFSGWGMVTHTFTPWHGGGG